MTTAKKLLIGAAVGAILGILYAPNKGSITRRRLTRTGDNIREKFNDFRDAVNEKIEGLKEDVDDEIAYHEIDIPVHDATDRPSF